MQFFVFRGQINTHTQTTNAKNRKTDKKGTDRNAIDESANNVVHKTGTQTEKQIETGYNR